MERSAWVLIRAPPGESNVPFSPHLGCPRDVSVIEICIVVVGERQTILTHRRIGNNHFVPMGASVIHLEGNLNSSVSQAFHVFDRFPIKGLVFPDKGNGRREIAVISISGWRCVGNFPQGCRWSDSDQSSRRNTVSIPSASRL